MEESFNILAKYIESITDADTTQNLMAKFSNDRDLYFLINEVVAKKSREFEGEHTVDEIINFVLELHETRLHVIALGHDYLRKFELNSLSQKIDNISSQLNLILDHILYSPPQEYWNVGEKIDDHKQHFETGRKRQLEEEKNKPQPNKKPRII